MFVEQSQIGTGKTRNGKLTDKLASLLEAVGQETGVHFVVVSGGQSAKHTPETYKKAGGWTGSHRHDEGNAADLKAYTLNSDGSQHYLNFDIPADQKLWGRVVQLSVAGGATGIGAGTHYMGPETVHIGFGKPATWGDGEKSANTPGWLNDAYQAGKTTPPLNIPDETATAPEAAPQPRVRPASLTTPLGRALGLDSGSATIPDEASFGVRGKSRLDVLNPGAPHQAFYDDPSMTMSLPSDMLEPQTIGAKGDGIGPGNLLDSRTAALLLPQATSADDVGAGPQASALAKMLGLGGAGTAEAPVPMQSRPAALSRTPLQQIVAPAPMPGRPSILSANAEAPSVPPPVVPRNASASFANSFAPAKTMVRTANGNMVATGLMPSSDGTHVLKISDDGTGRAKIEKLPNPGEVPGVLDPLREANSNTVAGGFIRSQLPKVMADAAGSASDNVGYAADSLKSSALNAASGLGKGIAESGVGNLASNIGNAFGSMFGGGAPASHPVIAPTVDDTRAEQRMARTPLTKVLAVKPVQQSWSPWGASPAPVNTVPDADLGYGPNTESGTSIQKLVAPTPAPVPAFRRPLVVPPVASDAGPTPLQRVLGTAFGMTPVGRLVSLVQAVSNAANGPKSYPNTGQLTMTDNNGPQVIGDHLNGSPRGLTVTGNPWFDSVRGL